MVYHGKPSSGCACCKRRRKKCDETRPQCRNCQKIGVECPGFPDKLDIMFKDETPNLVQRAQRSPKRSPPRVSTSPSEDNNKSLPTSGRSIQLSGEPPESTWSVTTFDNEEGAEHHLGEPSRDYYSTPGLADTIPSELIGFDEALSISHSEASFGDKMTRLFLSHFENPSDQQIITPGLVAVVKPWLEVVPSDSGLLLVVQAIAVRIMVIHHQRPDLLCRANALYYQAIATVQVSIVSTASSIHDDTLLTILLFAAYESLSTNSIANWSDHVRGAYSVLESRTSQRIDSPTSLILFRATRGNVLADALRQWERMPELSGSYGWLEGEPYSASGHVFEQFVELTHLLGRTKELWATITRDQETLLEAESMIERAMQLQEAFADPQACTQRNCTCISVMHFENSLESGAFPQVLSVSEPDSYSRWTMPESSTRHYCYIGQLYCARLVTRLTAWIEPTQYHENERFQAASFRTQHLHEVVQASMPHYLTHLRQMEKRNAVGTSGSPGPPISIPQLAHGLHMPPLHWTLISGSERERG